MHAMKGILPPRGIITVLNTPFGKNDAVDLDALQRNVKNAITAGVAGFLVPAMASEVGSLTGDERVSIVRAVLDANDGRTCMIGGASAKTGEERVTLARQLLDLHVPGILASIEYANDEQYLRDVGQLARLDPGFLMVQDWSTTGYGVPVATVVKAMAEYDAFKALKVEVVPAGVKYTELLEATGGKLHVSGGWAVMQMVEALDRGVHAFMPTGMHRIYTTIYSRYTSGDRPGAVALFEEILPVLAFSNQHLDVSIHFFKRLLHYQGVYPTNCVRAPALIFDATHERIAKELCARVVSIEERISIEREKKTG